jgi:hypothetical protein
MEKRQHFRVNQTLISQIFADNTNLFVMTGNLSANGIFLKSKKCLPVDSLITIQMVLPDNSVSSLKGIVRRTIDTSVFIHNGMGIQLIEKDGNYNRYLQSIHGEITPDDVGKPNDVCSETTMASIQEEHNRRRDPEWDKRQNPRYLLHDKQIEVMIGSSDEVNVVDISTGGISFKTGEKLDRDQHYVIQLNNKDRVLTLQGAVKWNALHEYRKLGSCRACIPVFHNELLPIYTVGMQFTSLLGHTSDEVMHFVDGLRKIDTVHYGNHYINLSDLILSEVNELMDASGDAEHQNDQSFTGDKNSNTGEKCTSALYSGSKERENLLNSPDKKMVFPVLENQKNIEIEKGDESIHASSPKQKENMELIPNWEYR